MCHACYEDFNRTVTFLNDLAMYAECPGADAEFVDITSYALASSLPFDRDPETDEDPYDGPENHTDT